MIGNLPAHPLIVHFTVVLLTLLPLAVLVSIAWPGLRRRLDWLLPLGALAAGLLAAGASVTGDVLERALPVSLPAVHTHTEWGQWAVRLAIAFALIVVVWWASVTENPLSWLDRPVLRGKGTRLALTILAAVVSAACLVVVTLTGHSGATAVWAR